MTYTMHEVPAVTLKLDASQEPQFKLLRFDMTTSTLDEVVAALKYNGGVIVKNFLTPEQVAETKEIVTPILKKIGYKKASDPTKRVARLPTITPKLVETILTHETYLGVTDAILSIHHRSWLGQKLFETVETPITMASTMFAVGPGAKEQDLHRDDSIYFNKHLAIKPEEYEVGRDMSISFFIAGVDVTAANGATRFIPGSHLERYDDQPDPSRAVSAEMNAGDCFFMLSSCYHGAGENSTKDQERLVYSLFAMQPHLRQVCIIVFRSTVACSTDIILGGKPVLSHFS